jgi:hypothetical protein
MLGATVDSLLTFHPDVIGLAETKKNWTRTDDTYEPI